MSHPWLFWLKKHLGLEYLLALAIVIGLFLRLLNLGTRELWYDEVLSLLLATGQKINYSSPQAIPVSLSEYAPLLNLPNQSLLKTIQGLLRGLYAGEPHPPLFFFAQHLWLRLFGNSETALRSLPALWSVGAIAAAFGLGRKLLSVRGGLLFAALIATNPFYLFHSLNVRMYTPLVVWAILSVWALLELMEPRSPKSTWIWQAILIGSISGGLLTFYLFAYWIVVIAALVLILDRCHWFTHALRLATAGLLTLPWAFWGTLKQLRNADLDRFNTAHQTGNPILLHLQGIFQTLGIHLHLGDWVTSLDSGWVVLSGIGMSLLLTGAAVYLWKAKQRKRLAIALTMGIFPLLLALSVDVLTGKFTLSFGWGRALIFIVPGCLLLFTIAIEHAGRWRNLLATSLLLVYLSINVGDLTLRQRQVFHQIAALIRQESTPTLIVLNSQAWGHVNRLVYYLPTQTRVDLLAQPSDKLDTVLRKTLESSASTYQRVLWLESAVPIWSPPTTDDERQQIQRTLEERFDAKTTQRFVGTMDLDEFQVSLYRLPSLSKP